MLKKYLWYNPSGGTWENGANWLDIDALTTGTAPGVGDTAYINSSYTTSATVISLNSTFDGYLIGEVGSEYTLDICSGGFLSAPDTVNNNFGELIVRSGGSFECAEDGVINCRRSFVAEAGSTFILQYNTVNVGIGFGEAYTEFILGDTGSCNGAVVNIVNGTSGVCVQLADGQAFSEINLELLEGHGPDDGDNVMRFTNAEIYILRITGKGTLCFEDSAGTGDDADFYLMGASNGFYPEGTAPESLTLKALGSGKHWTVTTEFSEPSVNAINCVITDSIGILAV